MPIHQKSKRTQKERIERIEALIDQGRANGYLTDFSPQELSSIGYFLDADDDIMHAQFIKALEQTCCQGEACLLLIDISQRRLSKGAKNEFLWLSKTIEYIAPHYVYFHIREKAVSLGESFVRYTNDDNFCMSSLKKTMVDNEGAVAQHFLYGLRVGALADKKGQVLSLLWQEGLINFDFCFDMYSNFVLRPTNTWSTKNINPFNDNTLFQIYQQANDEEKDRLIIQTGLTCCTHKISGDGRDGLKRKQRDFFRRVGSVEQFHEILQTLLGVFQEEKIDHEKIKNVYRYNFKAWGIFNFLKISLSFPPNTQSLELMRKIFLHPELKLATPNDLSQQISEFFTMYEKNLIGANIPLIEQKTKSIRKM